MLEKKMEAKNEDYGIIYVLSNKWFKKGLYKIGQTKRSEYQKRLRDLYYGKTGVPYNFKCEKAYYVPLDMLDAVEKQLHYHFRKKRVNTRREFFNVSLQEIFDAVELIRLGGLTMTEVPGIKSDFNVTIDKVTKADEKKSASEDPATSEPTKPTKKPNMDFFEMGLTVGTILIYNDDEAIRCKVIGAKKVEYNGTTYSLSNLTHQLLGTKHAVRPAPLWHTEDGTPLITLYNQYAQKMAQEHAAQLAVNEAAISAANAEYDQFKTECQ